MSKFIALSAEVETDADAVAVQNAFKAVTSVRGAMRHKAFYGSSEQVLSELSTAAADHKEQAAAWYVIYSLFDDLTPDDIRGKVSEYLGGW